MTTNYETRSMRTARVRELLRQGLRLEAAVERALYGELMDTSKAERDVASRTVAPLSLDFESLLDRLVWGPQLTAAKAARDAARW